MFLGGLWYLSGNLAAPAVAALATNSVDYFHLHQLTREDDKGSSRGGAHKSDSTR